MYPSCDLRARAAAAQGATEQDYRIADRAAQDGCAMVLVVNKWDTVPDKDGTTMVQYEKALKMAPTPPTPHPLPHPPLTSCARRRRRRRRTCA